MSKEKTRGEEEGIKVWHLLNDQLVELKSFLLAMFRSGLRFLFRNVIWFIALPVVSILFVFFLFSPEEPVYRSTMTVSYVHLEKKIYGDMIDKLNTAREQGMLYTQTGFEELTQEALNSIKMFDAQNIKNQPLAEDLSIERVPFYVSVDVTSTAYLSSIQEALIAYLNGSSFVQRRLEYNLIDAKKKLEAARFERTNALTLLEKYSNPEESVQGGAEILAQLEAVDKKISDLEWTISFNQNIEVLDGLDESAAIDVSNSTKQLFNAAVFGVLLAMLIGFFRIK